MDILLFRSAAASPSPEASTAFYEIGVLLLVLEAALLLAAVYWVVKKRKSAEGYALRTNILNIAAVFFIAYALYACGAIYARKVEWSVAGTNVLYYLSLIKPAIKMFAFEIDMELAGPVSQAYWVYNADFVILSFLAPAAAAIGVVGLFWKRIVNAAQCRRLFRKNSDIVIGYSPGAEKYIAQNDASFLWDPKMEQNTYNDLLKKGIPASRAPFASKLLRRMLDMRAHNLISFRNSAYSYADTLTLFEGITQADKAEINLYLEAPQEDMEIVQSRLISPGRGKRNSHVYCFNRYTIIAQEFVFRYPVSRYMPRSFLNDNGTLKQGKRVNVVLLGFGKVNREILKTAMHQYQFAAEGEDGLRVAPVHYYIYDFDKARLNDEVISKVQYDYNDAFAETDLPKPEPICDIAEKRVLDMHSDDAKAALKSVVGKDSFTYFIISLSRDFEDIYFAQSLQRLLGSAGPYRIFVRVKEGQLGAANRENDGAIAYFGSEDEAMRHSAVVNEDLLAFAKQIDAQYCKLAKADFMRRWSMLPFEEQYSNFGHALSIPFKLGLLGYAMTKEPDADDKVVDAARFYAKYANPYRSGEPAYAFYRERNPSNVLAFLEKSRWNAHYILLGFRQMRLSEIRAEKKGDGASKIMHKDMRACKHACLTTHAGLDQLHRYEYALLCGNAAAHAEIDTNDPDFRRIEAYKYDYMVMDNICDSLEKLGYAIVEL